MLLQHLLPEEIIFFAFVFAFLMVHEASTEVKRLILRICKRYEWIKYREFRSYNKIAPIILKLRKPWDCMKCMTFWFALALALDSGYKWESLLWGFVGLITGAIFDKIKSRWL